MSTIQEQMQQASAKNAELLRTLAETDHAQPALEQQIPFMKELDVQIKDNTRKLKELEKKRVAELADHVSYRDSHFKRFVYKATGQREKFDAKAEEEARQYFAVLQRQHETTILRDGQQQQLEEAQKIKEQLESAQAIRQVAQQELDNLYNSIFAGETPRFPEEDALERQSDQALQTYHDIRVRHEDESRIVNLLENAAQKQQEAIRSMDSALSASRMDIIGFDAAADYMERSHLARAEAAIKESRGLAQQAHVTDLPSVNLHHGSMVSDMIFDNIFTDLAFHDEIHRGKRETMQFGNALKSRTLAAKDRMRAVEMELKQAEKGLEQARVALQSERQKLFEQVASGKQ